MQTLLPVCALAAFAAPLFADRLVTTDGRILEVKKARALPEGDFQLVFESGEMRCPKALVASVEIEGDMADYVPANEDEKKKLEQGFVRYRGKWMGKAAYQAELGKQSEITKARTAELAAHASFYDAWKKETKHFELQSNTSPAILDQYADLLEAYYDQMDQRVGIDPSPILKKTKMKVCIYKSRPEFTELTKSPPGVAGFFNYAIGELHFYHDYQDPSVSQWIALHEGTHLLTFLVEPQARPCIWINEGVADYFGSADVTIDKKGKLAIRPGKLSLERVLTVQQALADGSYVPLEKLFETGREEFHAFEYAHAWSFVYFLNNAKPEYEKAFKKFFKDLYTIAKGVAFDLQPEGNRFGSSRIVQPVEVRRLLLDKLGLKDTKALEEEWKAYIAAIPIDAPVARFKRGLVVLQQGATRDELPKALEDLEAAIKAGVEDARAYWARGTLQLVVRGKEEDTLADYRRAVELAPLDPGYHVNLAQVLAGLSLDTPSVHIRMHDDDKEELTDSDDALSEAESHFGLACELAPENENLRKVRDTFLDMLQARSKAK